MDQPARDFFDLAETAQSFARSLRAENKQPRTVYLYLDAVMRLRAFLEERGETTNVRQVTRRHVGDFVLSQVETKKANTAASRFRALRRFFRWALAEGEIGKNPMDGMKQPTVPEIPVDIVTNDEMQKLLKVTQGQGFSERRDHALILMLWDTGVRSSELMNLTMEDVDLDAGVAIVLGKGRRPRTVAYGRRTTKALDRYIRVRARHPHAHLPNLWLGKFGVMTLSGLGQVVKKRGRQVGINGLHAHRFRHTMAASWLAEGGQEQDLMRLAGWKTRDMLARYGSATAEERAREAHKRFGPADRL
ncbi:MAG TPA: site-specific integrase [Actinomycetota bacterium]|jgi:site-specific recombinase XerD|nr:site-specific integrase [Actinomycetota bacterium]